MVTTGWNCCPFLWPPPLHHTSPCVLWGQGGAKDFQGSPEAKLGWVPGVDAVFHHRLGGGCRRVTPGNPAVEMASEIAATCGANVQSILGQHGAQGAEAPGRCPVPKTAAAGQLGGGEKPGLDCVEPSEDKARFGLGGA